MSIRELEAVIEQLPQEEYAELLAWVRQCEARQHQADEDAKEKKLAAIIRKGYEEFGLLASNRPSGLCKGQFTLPDDFNDPLPEDVLQDFEGR